ncbi:MAG: hypothetical protein LBD56_00645 [Endomicrobium sp.]|jgi:GGDEF domain-containing protein|nr:hypothetical protein [Endomicrobium sp.]
MKVIVSTLSLDIILTVAKLSIGFKIGSNILGCLIIATDKQYSDRFTDFIGFRRVTVFEIMSHRSIKDSLTGLLLKRYFLQRLEFEIQKTFMIIILYKEFTILTPYTK